MPLYSADVPIFATVYVKARNAAEAQRKIAALREMGIEVPEDAEAELPITGNNYSDPDLPDISLSPCMTFGRVPVKASLEVSAEDDELTQNCGQCEGSGRTQSASNGEPEECPVCDGKGIIPFEFAS